MQNDKYRSKTININARQCNIDAKLYIISFKAIYIDEKRYISMQSDIYRYKAISIDARRYII